MEVNKIYSDSRFATLESFKSNKTVTIPQSKAAEPTQDKVEVSAPSNDNTGAVPAKEPKKKKTSLFQHLKNGCAGFQKFFIGVAEYTKGLFKGIAEGAIAAIGVIGVDAVISAAKRAKAPESAEKATKMISPKGKAFAGVVAAVMLGYNLFKAHLNSSERKANVDHRWGTGHNQVD